jgi:hypothetical protein
MRFGGLIMETNNSNSMEFVLSILTVGLKPLYEKNFSYYKLISDFRKKLPRPQNEARKLSEKEIEQNPFLPNEFKHFTVVDVSTHKPTLNEQDLDFFYNSIKDFDYSFMIFKEYYKKRSANILRLKPTVNYNSLALVVLQEILRDDAILPLHPKEVLIHHLKHEYKLTRYLYDKFFS